MLLKCTFQVLLIVFLSFQTFASKDAELSIAVGSEFENLNPMIASQAVTNFMLYLAHRPLIILDLDLKWKPLLIKEIPTIENKMLKR